jgi:hypothetical protein
MPDDITQSAIIKTNRKGKKFPKSTLSSEHLIGILA